MAIYLGIGSNLGDRLANVNAAIATFLVLERSSIYETEPVDYHDQPWFLNTVIRVDTMLSPMELLSFCQNIETNLGRKREIPKGPRVIDIDLLFYDDVVLNKPPRLVLPHPAIADRKFVLEPMNEIAPDFVHPVLNKTITQLLKDCKDPSIVRKW